MSHAKEPDWAQLHSEDESWRKKLIGELSEVYAVPKWVSLFEHFFADGESRTFLELGSGNGDVAQAILKRAYPFIEDYCVSDYYGEGVNLLKSKGLKACQIDAQKIALPDECYDAVIEFDVMHHVAQPAQMAREMMRVARGRLFMTESNGLSLGRKLLELTPGHRRAGEKSYTPWQYRRFFNQPGFQVTRFEIHPFLFPLRLPRPFLRAVMKFNDWIEHVPLLCWQCSNVYIYIEYVRR